LVFNIDETIIHFFTQGTYRGKLIVKLGQHGVVDEDGRVLLQSLQLLQKTLIVFLAAVPGGHWLEQGLPCSITPLKDHHLIIKKEEKNTWFINMNLD